MAAVEARGVSAEQPFHAGNQVATGGFDDEMKVVPHQAIGVELPVCLGVSFPQGLQEAAGINGVLETRFPPVASIHHACPAIASGEGGPVLRSFRRSGMIEGSRIFHSGFARHVTSLRSSLKLSRPNSAIVRDRSR